MTRRSIIIVSAGLRSPSSTRNLADQLAASVCRRFETAGEPVDASVVEVREHAHAIADALLVGFPSGDLADAIRRVEAADALVVVTPTFQGSYSGLFKSFADLLDPEAVRGTPVLLAATGGSERHSLVIEHALRPLFAYLGAVTVPTGVYGATSDFGGAGAAALAGRIERAAGELLALAGQSERPRQTEAPGRPERPGEPERPGQPGEPGRPGEPGEPGWTERPGQSERLGQPGGPGESGGRGPARPRRAEATGSPRSTPARTPEVTPFEQLLAQVRGTGPAR